MLGLAIVAVLSLAPAGKAGVRSDLAKRVNKILVGTPMRHQGYELEAAGWRHHVHPAFMAAAAAVESSLGAASCQGNRFNVWGLGSCGSAWTVPQFATWRQAVNYFGAFVRSHWPHAHSPWDLAGYCPPCSPPWGDRVAGWMRSWGFAPTVDYGR